MKKSVICLLSAAALLCSACANAMTVSFPAKVSAIPEEAFKGSSQVEGVMLHDNIASIGNEAFAGTSVGALYTDADLSGISIADNAFDGKTLLVFPSEYGQITLGHGDSMQLAFSSWPRTLQGKISYSSSNPSAVYVDEAGKIYAVGSGASAITISDESGAAGKLHVTAKSYNEVHRPISIAHRGASGYYPDNTIPAFANASALGADMIELDILRTADGQIVCHHDTYVVYKGTSYDVEKLTLEQLRIAKPNVCTLEEALAVIAPQNILLQIEFKSTGGEAQVLQLVRNARMENRTCYGSFNYTVLTNMKALDSSAKTVFIVSDQGYINTLMANPSAYVMDIVSVSKSRLRANPYMIYQLHLAGKQVYGWTINTNAELREFASIGLDGIITDYPDRAT